MIDTPLRTVREEQGLGLRELARRARVDAAHLSRIERGQASASVSSLRRVAGELGLRDLAAQLAPYDRGERSEAA